MQSMVSGNNSNSQGVGSNPTSEIDFYQWVSNLNSVESREKALLELCRMRESLQNFAPLLWHSYGTVTALLQEITAVYPYINPPNLTAHQSNRVCNALALLQCLASHPLTRSEFLKAQIPLYLYQFLNTSSQSRPFEYLRLTSLGVIGALAKTDEPDAISFLLNSEIIPLCLQIMESGLDYICQTYDRFSHVASILNAMVGQLVRERSIRLLKHVIRCYQRLADNPRKCFPTAFVDGTFNDLLAEEPATQRSLTLLIEQMNRPQISSNAAGVAPSAAADSVDNSGLKVNVNSNNDVGENIGDISNAGADNQ
ncbi:unnamed protein product [Rodentolepis nana]|uniref:CCR4-NOT transcription complex subunit 9 n=1 Tax=Rodentolepis nana TaxID=102285 RepID=A0A0R3TTU0_RODNA|nr:unnamed protein product [Rodentolepis nana]